MNKFLPFCIFASGNGSNAEVLAKYCLDNNLPLKFILTDNESAGVINRVNALNISVKVVKYINKAKFESEVISLLSENNIHIVFLAGFMKILSENFLENFLEAHENIFRVINIHPSLLPKYPGKQAYLDAFNDKCTSSGITIHYVDKGIDTGKIIYQKSFKRYENDSFEEFKERGLKIEHSIYPQILDLIIRKYNEKN